MKTPENPSDAEESKIAAEHDAFALELAPLVREALKTKTALGVAMALLTLAAQTLFHDGLEGADGFKDWAGVAFKRMLKGHGRG